MKIRTRGLVVAVVLLGATPYGCSFSYSSKSISDSVAASSKSISDSSESSSPSDSSTSATHEAQYREDVRDFTAAYVRQGDDIASLQRGLAAIAERHGVSDWEAVAATWEGVGEGLRLAHAPPVEVDAISEALARGDSERRREIARGYSGDA